MVIVENNRWAETHGTDIVDTSAVFGTNLILILYSCSVVDDRCGTDRQIAGCLFCIDSGTGIVHDRHVCALLNRAFICSISLKYNSPTCSC